MIQALLFDGHSARGQAVQLHVQASELVAEGQSLHRWPLSDVQWPERTRHGQRVIHLRGGASLQVADGAAFDAWRRSMGLRDSWIVRAQQHWPTTLAAVLLLVALCAAGYLWGVPLAAHAVLAAVPASADRAVGEAAMDSIGPRWLRPSKLPPERQQRLRAAFDEAVQRAYPGTARPAYELRFQATSEIGANAFALPGGVIVITDELVTLLDGHDDAIVGVLGHELGHVRLRHGMQALVRFSLIGAATSVALGDFSSVLAGVPAIIGQLGYARDAERQADAEAVHLLRASGRSPAVMVVLFERLGAAPDGSRPRRSALPIALASHPMNDERAAYFRAAAAAR